MPTGDAVREVKEKLDIVEVISSYVRLQRAGRDYKGLCPFHSEKSPSFTVSGEKQVWYCFGCGEGGDVIRFVEKAENTDFAQTLHALAERAGVVLDDRPGGRKRAKERERAKEANRLAAQYFHYVLQEHRLGARGLRYLRDRGVEDETIAGFEVGYAPAGRVGDNLLRFLRKKGVADEEAVQAGLALPARGGGGAIDRFRARLMIPIRDDAGTIVAFGGRAMDPNPAKYMNSPQTAIYDKGRSIFGLSHARKAIAQSGRALLVEGYFDVMMAHQNGIQIAVASSGTAVTDDQVRTLRRLAGDLLLCLDGDEAGRHATERVVEMASRAGMRVRVVELPNAKDPGEFFQKTPQLWGDAEGAALAGWEWWLDGVLRGFDLRRADARAAAAQAAVHVLNRIPEEASLDIYCQLAAERLKIDAARLLVDVQRVRRGEAPREPEPVAPPRLSGQNGHRPVDRPEEDRLVQLLLADPRALAILDQLTPGEEIGSAGFRDLRARVGELLGSGGSLERHLERFSAEEGARLARLSLTASPPGDEAELRAALNDCVDRIRLRDYESAMAELEVGLADGDAPEADRAQLLTRHHDLARRRTAIKMRLRHGRA
ncbi:MAG TPA: DNA primase [Candidatus Dormibacteraeota bacterium]|nr:DNA primase [Candidatus Dormibacteraeota bacterium]